MHLLTGFWKLWFVDVLKLTENSSKLGVIQYWYKTLKLSNHAVKPKFTLGGWPFSNQDYNLAGCFFGSITICSAVLYCGNLNAQNCTKHTKHDVCNTTFLTPPAGQKMNQNNKVEGCSQW